MENTAQKHLMKIVDKLEEFYGTDIVDIVEIIDFYINYYHHTESQKRELFSAHDAYKRNEAGADVNNLLATIQGINIEERTCTAVNSDMFDLLLLKKFISNLGVTFALNEPERQRKSAEAIKQYEHLHNVNLHNEN